MRILAVDISGKVDKYDRALYESVKASLQAEDQMVFACPTYSIQTQLPPLSLCNLIPKKHKHSKHLWKRMLKVVEGIINYGKVARYIRREQIDVMHLQWLPFMEICSLEKHWLKWVRRKNPRLKILLTVHNIYPHNCSAAGKEKYRQRMVAILPLIDCIITHTQDTARSISKVFGIPAAHVAVVHHGIFTPQPVPAESPKHSGTRLLLFGQQSHYKGTDLLIHASELLPEEVRRHLHIRIVGYTDSKLYNTYWQRAADQHIEWRNQYLSDQELYQEIQASDILIFPYREISQSGALLLGLYFEKPVIASCLPTFIETLGDTYPKQFLFQNGDAQDLADTITWCVGHSKETKDLPAILHHIVEQNSWESAARKTIQLYHTFKTNHAE